MKKFTRAVDLIESGDEWRRWPKLAVNWPDSRQFFFQQKYVFERLAGCFLLVFTFPVIFGLWLLVKATSKGPGFYRQTRVGLNGSTFQMLKLRSMRNDAESDGDAIWCFEDDPRITIVGRVMRSLHLDELPQLWNVTKGDMVLVGPRPERPEICNHLSKKIEGYFARVLVKPGISGLSQINLPADRCLDDVRRKQILDIYYINETGLGFEIRILVATALRMLGIKGETIIRVLRISRRSLLESAQSNELNEPVPVPLPKFSSASNRIIHIDGSVNPLQHFFHEHFKPGDYSIRNAADQLRPAFASKRAKAIEQERRASSNAQVPNCMTVDVEDYFQVSGFADRITRKDWHKYECRVEQNTDRILKIFESSNVRATFFVLGWIADRYPKLIQRIAESGHEIASHGYWHQLVYHLTPEQFAKDLVDSREAIFNACGVVVTAYRAPSFSIVKRSRWALDVLTELGFRMDSSIFPISGHERYGDTDSPERIHHVATAAGKIIEVPPTVGRAHRIPIPVGGGYFRLFPLWMTNRSIKDIRSRIGPAIFYLHPWELDPEQPRLFSNASRKNRARHYVGLKSAERKLRSLLETHRFDTMSNVVRSVMPQSEYIPGIGCNAISDRSSAAIHVEPAAAHAFSESTVATC